MTTGHDLAIRQGGGIVEAAVTPQQAIEHWKQYQQMCQSLLTDDDYHTYRDGQKRAKKSAWRKLATAFNLTDRVLAQEVKEDIKGRPRSARFEVEVTANNGRSAIGVGGAHVNEKCCPAGDGEPCDKDHEHCSPGCTGYRHWSHPDDITTTAHTRAKNRAIADLIGGGEVSAEEVDDDRHDTKPRKAPEDAPLGLCPVHKTPFVSSLGKDGKPWVRCPKKVGDGWCKERPQGQPVASTARIVDQGTGEITTPPAGKLPGTNLDITVGQTASINRDPAQAANLKASEEMKADMIAQVRAVAALKGISPAGLDAQINKDSAYKGKLLANLNWTEMKSVKTRLEKLPDKPSPQPAQPALTPAEQEAETDWQNMHKESHDN